MGFEELVYEMIGAKCSQAYIAAKIGMSQGAVSKNLKGRQKVSAEFIAKLKRGFDLSSEQYRKLMTVADISSYPVDNEVVAQDIIEKIATTFASSDIDQAIKTLICEDINMVIATWSMYQKLQVQNGNREWEKTNSMAEDHLQKLELIQNRQIAYMRVAQGRALNHLDQSHDARRYVEWSLNHTHVTTDYHHQATCHTILGDIFRDEGNWEQAISQYWDAIRICQSSNDILGVLRAKWNLAIVYLFRGDYQQAFPILQRSIEIFKDRALYYELAKTYSGIAWAYNLSGEWDLALKYHKKSLEIVEHDLEKHHPEALYMKMLCFSYLGNDYRQARNPMKAKEWYTKANELSREFADTKEQGWILHGLARVHGQLSLLERHDGNLAIARKHYQQAIKYFNDAVTRNYQVHFSYRLAMTKLHFGRFLIDYGNKDDLRKAKALLESALEQAEKIGSQYYQTQAMVFLCEVYQRTQNYDNPKINTYIEAAEQLHKNSQFYRMMARLRLVQCFMAFDTRSVSQAIVFLTDSFRFAIKYNLTATEEVYHRLNRYVSIKVRHDSMIEDITKLYKASHASLKKNSQLQDNLIKCEFVERCNTVLSWLEESLGRIEKREPLEVPALD